MSEAVATAIEAVPDAIDEIVIRAVYADGTLNFKIEYRRFNFKQGGIAIPNPQPSPLSESQMIGHLAEIVKSAAVGAIRLKEEAPPMMVRL